MTKVSMRHLNEIVRERNQYSRDTVEAWQDYINLKGRLDTELSKVTKRNNFLAEELESWKQQVRSPYQNSPQYGTNMFYSSSSSKPLQKILPKMLQLLRSKSRHTSARTAASLTSSNSIRTMLLDLLFALMEPRSSVTMLWKLWSCSKKSRKNSNVKGREIRRN